MTYQVPLDLDGRHLINPSHDVSLTGLMEKLVRDTPDGGYNLILRRDGYLIVHPAEPTSDWRWVGQVSLENVDDPAIVRIYELIDDATAGNLGTVSLVQNRADASWLAVSEVTGTGHGGFHLMLIDVDHFKLFNDSYGNAQGDEVLRQIAGAISRIIRQEDRVYRYGGEELAVLFTRAEFEPVDKAAGLVMDALRGLAIAFPESGHGIVTVSAGLMHCRAGHNSVGDVIAEADRRLYTSKRNGRNCLTTE